MTNQPSDSDKITIPKETALSPRDLMISCLRGRCPRCGKGKLYSGFLTIRSSCDHCNLDFSFSDSGDGPAVFIILIVGFLIIALAFYTELTYAPPIWLHFVIWIPMIIFCSLALLQPSKSLMIALQYKNQAHEGELDTSDKN